MTYIHPAVPTKVPSLELTEREVQDANAGIKEAQGRNESHPQRHQQGKLACCYSTNRLIRTGVAYMPV